MASLTRRVPVALPTLAGVHDTQRPDNGGVAGAAYWETCSVRNSSAHSPPALLSHSHPRGLSATRSDGYSSDSSLLVVELWHN